MNKYLVLLRLINGWSIKALLSNDEDKEDQLYIYREMRGLAYREIARSAK